MTNTAATTRRIRARAGKWAAIKRAGVVGESFAAALQKARDLGWTPSEIAYNFDAHEIELRKSLRFHLRDARRIPIGNRWRNRRGVGYSCEQILKIAAWLKEAKATRTALLAEFGPWEPLADAWAYSGRHRYTEMDLLLGEFLNAAGVGRWPREAATIAESKAYIDARAALDAAVLAAHNARK